MEGQGAFFVLLSLLGLACGGEAGVDGFRSTLVKWATDAISKCTYEEGIAYASPAPTSLGPLTSSFSLLACVVVDSRPI